MRSTHTFAVLELSPAAYAEIKQKLEAAGYEHAFTETDGKPTIDMQGIGIRASVPEMQRNYTFLAQHPDNWSPFNPTPIGALREALAWIESPRISLHNILTYGREHHCELTNMLRRALAMADRPREAERRYPRAEPGNNAS